MNNITEKGNLLVSDNASTVFEITPMDIYGECTFITKNPVEGDDYHYIDSKKAKMIIEFLQKGLDSIETMYICSKTLYMKDQPNDREVCFYKGKTYKMCEENPLSLYDEDNMKHELAPKWEKYFTLIEQ